MWSSSSSKNVFSLFIFITPLLIYFLYPLTANAGLFSFISDIVGDKASAQIKKVEDVPNSQTMTLLKASYSINNSEIAFLDEPILSSENVLLPEIGPSGTVSELKEPINTQISIYVVREGDTLSEIARLFDVSVNTIIWANNLGKNKIIKRGQTLVILPISGINHKIEKGETIKSIVAKYKANLEEVLQYNNISINSTIKKGDIIIVPDAEPTFTNSSGLARASAKAPSYSGYYIRPISSGKKSQGLHGYNAVDLAAPIGTPIYASAAGTVIASMNNNGWNGGYGNYVIISHSNGTQTLYSHNQTNLVSVGQKVNKGDIIAKIGVTGKTTGAHVHFEIRGAKNPF